MFLPNGGGGGWGEGGVLGEILTRGIEGLGPVVEFEQSIIYQITWQILSDYSL